MTTNFVELSRVPVVSANNGRALKVYALVDPRDLTVRYVGVTNKSLQFRLDWHLRRPTNSRTRAWFSDLRRCGLRPEIVKLQNVVRDWQVCEMQWIAWFRARGDLLNIDAGGERAELGTGWDDIKRAKAALLASTIAHDAWDDFPPPCALAASQFRGRSKPRSSARARGKITRTVPSWCQEKSVDPTVRRNGKIVSVPTLMPNGDASSVSEDTENTAKAHLGKKPRYCW